MTEPVRGLYEVLLTEALAVDLDAVATRSPAATRALRSAEASDRIAWHLSKQVEAAIAGLSDADRVEVGIRVARDLIGRLDSLIGSDNASLPTEPGSVLHAVWGKRPDGSSAVVDEPLIPLLDTTLLTNAPGEPSMWGQLRSEI